MGAIEDLRKVIQDLITPDLKAIAAKLEMLEKRMDGFDARMDRLDGRIDRLDGRIDRLESNIKQEFERAERSAEARLNQLLVAMGHERRIKQLEEERHQ